LHDYLCSPFFNKNPDLVVFFTYLKKHYPDFDKASFSKENAFSFIYQEDYNEKKIGYLMSDLLKMVEGYLVQKQLDENPFEQNLKLLLTYKDWKLEKPFKSTLREIEKYLQKGDFQDAKGYYQSFLVEEIKNLFFDQQQKRTYDESLQIAIDNLDFYYLSQKLKYSCEIINRQNILTANYELKLFNEILEFLRTNPQSQKPYIAIYYQILQTLIDSGNEEHFECLKELLKDYTPLIGKEEARHMYHYTINYCIQQLNKGDAQYLREAFELYKIILDNEVLVQEEKMDHRNYKNITSIACLLGEFEWAETFTNEYIPYIEKNLRHNALMYNMAQLHFHQKDFNKAHHYLSQMERSEVFYDLGSRSLLLKVYYELNELKALQSLLNSFRIYLKRNRIISDYQREIYLNLIKYLKELIRSKGQTEKLKEMKQAIMENKNIATLEWLLSKVNQEILATV